MANVTTNKVLAKAVTYADTSSTSLGFLPANAYIDYINVNVDQGFDEAIIDIGDGTTANKYANDVDVETSDTAATVTLTNCGAVESTENPTEIKYIVVPTSTTLTEGSCTITVGYVQL